MSLFSFLDPRRLHVFCIDVIYCIIIVGCNNVIVMVLMLIIADYSRWISSQDVSVFLVGPTKNTITSCELIQLQVILYRVFHDFRA